jgi:UDP-perosamine 4-acetyltransferase
MRRILCLGAGGHAAVLLDAVRSMGGDASLVGLVTHDGAHGDVLGVPALGRDEELAAIARRTEASWFIVGVGTIKGGGTLRERLFSLAQATGLRPYTVMHPSAVVAGSAVVEAGAQIMAGAVIQARARIGENAIVNTRAGIDHDCAIGAHAHIAPGATLSGSVRVGRCSHVGAGATVRQGVTIGDGATIGIGAALIRDCPAHAVMLGVPARAAGASG